ncbi:MAG: class I SAM-dependent methyltransferase [Acidobacteriia bacterium]|nr:class I SAM-dependent methyltransferase [Terriglobia bacterium]
MHEILDHLAEGARVLDLGSRDGSFSAGAYPHLVVVSVDLKSSRGPGRLVQSDAAQLPFRSRSFDAVLLNHSLEHFEQLKRALQEIGRVVKQDGAIYAAVPDARTLSDRIYRKVYADSGGHVNLFGSESELARMLSWYFGLPHVATRVLCSSMAFWNSRNTKDIVVQRQMQLPSVWEPLLAASVGALRLVDRVFHTRAQVYGWAFYFGTVGEAVDTTPRVNVCVRCGQAHASDGLVDRGVVRKRWIWFRAYRCPDCGASNFFADDLAGQ